MSDYVFPRGYSHDTRSDGLTVTKRYVAAPERRITEREALRSLAGSGLPVPRVLEEPPGALVMTLLPGVHGQELIEAGHAAQVLFSCGRALPSLPFVHGDYGPNNTLYDPSSFAVTAILDWEFAHEGDPLEDLAWAEWIVRRHHPSSVGDLDALFDGYGSRPPWELRQTLMLAKCEQMLALPRLHEGGAARWRDNIEITRSWH